MLLYVALMESAAGAVYHNGVCSLLLSAFKNLQLVPSTIEASFNSCLRTDEDSAARTFCS
jgi:hypothetical protein